MKKNGPKRNKALETIMNPIEQNTKRLFENKEKQFY